MALEISKICGNCELSRTTKKLGMGEPLGLAKVGDQWESIRVCEPEVKQGKLAVGGLIWSSKCRQPEGVFKPKK